MLKIYQGTLRTAICTFHRDLDEWRTPDSIGYPKCINFCHTGINAWQVDKYRDKIRLACSLVDDGDGIAKVTCLAHFLRLANWSHWAGEELIRRSAVDDIGITHHAKKYHMDDTQCSGCGYGHEGVTPITKIVLRTCDPHQIASMVPVFWWPEIV